MNEAQPPVGRPQLREAPRYDGKESFSSFVRSLNDYLNAHLYTEDEGRRMLPFLLTGSSRDAYETLERAVREGPWAALLDRLRDLIHTDDRQMVAQAELSRQTQGGRNVETFFRCCKEICWKAYPGADALATRDAILKSTFINGLQEEIKHHVQRGMPRDAEQALQIAKREESLRNISTNDSLTAAINKLTLQVAAMDNRSSDQVNYIQSNAPQNNWNQRFNGGQGSNRGRGNFRGNHQNRGNSNYRGNNQRGNYQHRGNSQNRGHHHHQHKKNGRPNGGYVNAVFDPCETVQPDSDIINAVSSPVRKPGQFSSLLFVTCIVALLLPTASAWTAVKPMSFIDCSTPNGQALIHPPRPTSCHRSTCENIRKGFATMQILNQTREEIPSFKCRIEVFNQCTTSTLFIPWYNMSYVRSERPTDIECREAIEDKMWQGKHLKKSPNNLFKSELESNWPSTGFNVDSCQEGRRMVLEKGLVEALPDGKMISSTMVNQNNCQIEDERCESPEALLLWKYSEKKSSCKTIQVGKFAATIGDYILIIDQMENAFPIDSTFQPQHMAKCFSAGTYSSNGLTFFTFEEDAAEKMEMDLMIPVKEEHQRQIPESSKLLNLLPPPEASSVRTTTKTTSPSLPMSKQQVRIARNAENVKPEKEEMPGVSSIGSRAHVEFMKNSYDGKEDTRRNLSMAAMNHKVQYLTKKMEDHFRDNFNRQVEAICHTRNRQLRMWRMFLDLDPQAAMRVLLRRDDIIASFKGRDVVQVSQCSTVVINRINEDRTDGDSCLSKTAAMTTDNKLVYIQPGSIEVDHEVETMDCRFISNYIWQDDQGNWKELNTTRNVTEIEEEGIPTYEARQLIFTAGDIYAGVKESSFPMMLAVSFGASIRSLQYQHQQETLKALIGSNGSRGGNNSSKAVVEYVFDGATMIVDGVTSWFTSWYFIAMAVASIIIVVLIVVGVIFVKFYFGKKAVTTLLGINSVKASAPEETEELNEMRRDDDQRSSSRPAQGGWSLPPLFTYIPIIIPLICTATASQSMSNIPFVHIAIADKGFVALWDSGASISYVSRSSANHLNIPIKPGKIRTAKAANGTSFQFLGTFHAPVRIGSVMIDHEFLVAEDECCPGHALLGIDFMKALDRRGIMTSLRPAANKLQIGDNEIQLVGENAKGYDLTNAVMEMINAEELTMKPGGEYFVKLANGRDIDADEAVLLKSTPNGFLAFDNTLFHPLDSRETTLRVVNTSNKTIQLKEGDVIGKGKIVRLQDIAKPRAPDVPKEANWEEQLLETNGSNFMEKIDWAGSDINDDQKKKLMVTFQKFRKAFFNEDGDIGLFKGGIEHIIEIRQDLPFPKSRTYRVPIGNQAEVEKQEKEMLRLDVIEPSKSEFTSPIVLVRKKDGSARFTTDFRLLNAVTKKQNYQIPLIADIVDLASHGKFFTNLDLIQGFFQIPLREQDRHLTAFATPTGTYQYKRMPMGLCGAPHTFQTAVRELQRRTKAKLFCYLDDLLIVSNSIEQHLEDIAEVLEKIAEIGFKIKIEKCKFAQPEVTFLGLLVGRHGVKPNPTKVKSIQEFPVPKSPTGVRGFLGMTNYFRRFIKQYAEIAAPLHDLTKKDQKFIWKTVHQSAFEKLKEALCSSPVLQPPRPGRPFVIESDASSIAVGAMLLQAGDDGELHPIAYDSRKLTETERKYPPIETEALGLTFAVKAFRTYILGSPVTAIVDHRPLTSLMHRRDLIGRLAKYQIILQELDLTILYRPGQLNSVCDALSRYIEDEVKEVREKPKKIKDVSDEEAVNVLRFDEIKKIQHDTPWIAKLAQQFQEAKSSSLEKYAEKKGVVYCKKKDDSLSILLPNDKDIIDRILKEYHATSHLGAHLGVEKTIANISRRFYWTNLAADVKDFIKRCPSCNRRKTNPHQETKEPLGRLEQLSGAWERLHADICGPFPITAAGNRYIFTIKDDFTKYVMAFPIPKQDATTIADVFVKEVVLRYGAPKVLLTDNGSNFKSVLFEAVLKLLEVNHSLTAPYHKSANGTVERVHRTIEESLSSFVNSKQTDWDEKLPFVMFSINSVPHTVTKISPHRALFGRELSTPEDNLLQPKDQPISSHLDLEDFGECLNRHLKDLHISIKEKLQNQLPRTKDIYERSNRIKEREVQVGSKVFVKRNPPINKLMAKLHGPFKVIGVDKYNVHYMDGHKKKIANKDDVRLEEGMEGSHMEGSCDEGSRGVEEGMEGSRMEVSRENGSGISDGIAESRMAEKSNITSPRRSQRIRWKKEKVRN
ncbi:unnamed protein product [Caenorhabditis nigoni]